MKFRTISIYYIIIVFVYSVTIISLLSQDDNNFDKFNSVNTIDIINGAENDDFNERRLEIWGRIRNGKDRDLVFAVIKNDKTPKLCRSLAIKAFDQTGDEEVLKYLITEIKNGKLSNLSKNTFYFSIAQNSSPNWIKYAEGIIHIAEIDKDSPDDFVSNAAKTMLKVYRDNKNDTLRSDAIEYLINNINGMKKENIKTMAGWDGSYLFEYSLNGVRRSCTIEWNMNKFELKDLIPPSTQPIDTKP